MDEYARLEATEQISDQDKNKMFWDAKAYLCAFYSLRDGKALDAREVRVHEKGECYMVRKDGLTFERYENSEILAFYWQDEQKKKTRSIDLLDTIEAAYKSSHSINLMEGKILGGPDFSEVKGEWVPQGIKLVKRDGPPVELAEFDIVGTMREIERIYIEAFNKILAMVAEQILKREPTPEDFKEFTVGMMHDGGTLLKYKGVTIGRVDLKNAGNFYTGEFPKLELEFKPL